MYFDRWLYLNRNFFQCLFRFNLFLNYFLCKQLKFEIKSNITEPSVAVRINKQFFLWVVYFKYQIRHDIYRDVLNRFCKNKNYYFNFFFFKYVILNGPMQKIRDFDVEPFPKLLHEHSKPPFTKNIVYIFLSKYKYRFHQRSFFFQT